jgi:hypothetical protein
METCESILPVGARSTSRVRATFTRVVVEVQRPLMTHRCGEIEELAGRDSTIFLSRNVVRLESLGLD